MIYYTANDTERYKDMLECEWEEKERTQKYDNNKETRRLKFKTLKKAKEFKITLRYIQFDEDKQYVY
jgi:hypothetical protein